jgi:hypothetical protein
MQKAPGYPVVEPAGAVVRHIETMVMLGVAQSKRTWPMPQFKKRDYGSADVVAAEVAG